MRAVQRKLRKSEGHAYRAGSSFHLRETDPYVEGGNKKLCGKVIMISSLPGFTAGRPRFWENHSLEVKASPGRDRGGKKASTRVEGGDPNGNWCAAAGGGGTNERTPGGVKATG